MTFGYFIVLGSHVDSTGKAMISNRNADSTPMNGTALANRSRVVKPFGSRVLRANSTSPDGGQMLPISEFTVVITPSHSGLMPSATSAGKISGMVMTMMVAVSSGAPRTNSSTL